MNLEMPSVVANRMYAFGETYAIAKAWVLANLSTDSGDDGTSLDAIQAAITTTGGLALASRSESWYNGNTLFSTLPASSPELVSLSGLNLTGQDGNVVEVVNGTFALGAGGGSGIASFGAVGSAPSANGATVAGTVATLQPADGTHPGVVTSAAQTVGGVKTFNANIGAGASGANGVATLGLDSIHTSPGLWLGITPGSETFTNAAAFYTGSTNYIGGAGQLNLYIGGANFGAFITGVFDIGSFSNAKINFGYSDTSGTPGTTATNNTPTGRFALASGSAAITVTCTSCNASGTSIVTVQNETTMGTALQYKVVPGNGSFVVTCAANAPTDIVFSFSVFN